MMQGEILLQTDDVLIRIMPLGGFGATPWHTHTNVTDRILTLAGRVAVEFRDPDEIVVLQHGDFCTVETGRVHRVVNAGDQPARYLLIQGVGRYDFNATI